MEEIWKPVKDYENLYEISNLGRIKSKFKKWTVCNYKSKKDMIVYMNEKILSPSISKCGYKQIILSKNGKQKLKLIHRLVAETFIPNYNNYKQVNHKNGNKQDNRVENLEWCTAKENIRHSWKNGLSTPYWKNKFGKENPKSIKINQYDKNGNFIKTWESINMAARKLNIDCGRITKCCKKYPHCKTAGGFIWEYYTN